MSPRSSAAALFALLGTSVGLGSVVSCGAPPPVRPPSATDAPIAQAGGPKAVLEARRRTHRPAPPPAPPPPRTTAPMAGEPDAKRLAEARLQKTTCDATVKEVVDARLADMRQQMRESYMDWHGQQPDCWAADREAAAERKREEAELRQGFGGGRGYGIGLGSVGTIGHGSGTGSGMGSVSAAFGSGGLGLSGAGEGGGGSGARGHMWGSGEVTAEPAKAGRHSGTNNQVATVDEADLVKTDGRWVYLATAGALRIVEAMNPRVVSVTKIPGAVKEMFVEGDRAVVYASSATTPERCTYGYDCQFAGDGTSTAVIVLDVSRREAPTIVRRIDLSGSLVAARRIGNAIHTVVADGDSPTAGHHQSWPDGLDMCGNPEAKVRAALAKLEKENERQIRAEGARLATMREGGVETNLCGTMLRTPIRDGRAFTSLVSFDLTSNAAPTTTTIQSRPGAVFASRDALYMAVVHRRSDGSWYSFENRSNELTDIHKFRIGEKPEATKYVGSGAVPGHVLNQFAMDEWYGYLRVATTNGKVPNPNVSSSISVLAEAEGGALVRVGAVTGLARGEDIRAVRFEEERGYVVTFKKTDPLFVLELGDPAHPRVAGELKIPGFSTYMHRIDRDHLLSIGLDANDHGDFAYFDGVTLQMFDVADAKNPRLVHKEKIGTRGSSSQALTNHLAFNFFREEGLLAVPMTICDGGGDGTFGEHMSFSGLLVYDVDTERGFTRLGGVDHGDHAANVSCGTWWSNATSAVKRSVFLDDLVYSVAPERLKVQRLSVLGKDLADIAMKP